MSRILLVEDDVPLGEGVAACLQQDGLEVSWVRRCADVAECWMRADLVVLDRQLPEGDSVQWLPDWLSLKALPVIVLTARTEVEDRIAGLQAGARDYVLKPFVAAELLARVRVQLRPVGEVLLQYRVDPQQLTVSLARQQAWLDGEEVALKPKEFSLLALLLRGCGRVFHRDELLNLVWGYEAFPSTRTVDNHILNLRRKLPLLHIDTVRGMGYRLNPADAQER